MFKQKNGQRSAPDFSLGVDWILTKDGRLRYIAPLSKCELEHIFPGSQRRKNVTITFEG